MNRKYSSINGEDWDSDQELWALEWDMDEAMDWDSVEDGIEVLAEVMQVTGEVLVED